jgi:outer membrane protein OmpA-like peptidoglycan-associated protein/tetratricopeptide (TPR) repeat protein
MTILHKNMLFVLVCFFLSTASIAQSSKLRKAHSSFEQLEYPQSIRMYEELLSDKKISLDEKKQILLNLSMAYKKLKDYRNAERTYKDLFSEFENTLEPQQFLHYAQVLAGNAKYRDSQKMFSKYGEFQKEDLRAGKFALAYMDNSVFFKDSASYKIQYLDKLNTRFSDFSPMYYENGLVFVAARKEGTIIKRIFNQDETPFLDLFLYPDSSLTFIPDSTDIGEEALAELKTSPIAVTSLDKAIANPPNTVGDFEVEEFHKKLNSKYHEGPVTFSRDFKKIIFTRNNYHKGKVKKNDKGINLLKLYSAEKKGNKWVDVKELPFNSNNFSTGHPAFSPDNRRLYFVSDMPGGYGGTDLYVVDYIDGEWSSPINLGREVNTEGNEMFPYIDQYGNLYFASDGHAGLGGLDIFYMEMRNGIPFAEVENLGAPINSEKDDFGLITDGKRQSGYFSSNRKRGYSDDNIYSFVRGCNQLNIKIFDNVTKTPIVKAEVRLIKNGVNRDQFESDDQGTTSVCLEPGADFYFKIFKDGYSASTITYGTLSSSLSKNQSISIYLEPSKIPMVRGRIISEMDHTPVVAAQVTLENTADGSTETVITGLDGRYTFQPAVQGDYIVKAVKENAVTAQKQVDLNEKSLEDDLSIVAVGDILELKNIYYDYGKYTMNTTGKKEIKEKVLPLLQQYPDIKIELRSHTDSRSSANFNLKLSQQRADDVKKYLISLGVKPQRILAKGYGKSELLNHCDEGIDCTSAQHRQNRRTEIKILAVPDYVSN